MTFPLKSYRLIVVVSGIVTTFLVLDMELSNIADLLHPAIISPTGVNTFIVINTIYLIGQFILLRFSRTVTSDLRSRREDIRRFENIVSIIQVFIVIVFILLITEIIFQKRYDVFILVIVTILSNGLTAGLMFYLFNRLLGYYRSHNQNTILLYAIAGIIISITAVVTILFTVPVMLIKPAFISATTDVVFPTFVPGSVLDILNYAYYILSILSFVGILVGTVGLLHHYARKMGALKFWFTITLPLAFYLGQIVVISLRNPILFLNLDPVTFIFYYRVIFTVSSTIGGILFSQPFFLVSRLIPQDSNMHRHLIILAVGMVLFFVSGSATVYHTPYPPFGLATVALIGTSSYMLFLGLYSCAISLSEDMELYKLIRSSAKEWKFFLNISEAEVEKTVLEKVGAVKQLMTKETGIAPSVSISDAKDYLTAVLDQLKKDK